MRVGVVVLPEHGRADTARIWRELDRAGVHHGWTFDHIAWRSQPGEPWFDGMTTLAAVAMITERIRLGTLVISPNYRHPVLTAQQLMTLDHLTKGRMVAGIGAGADGPDATVLGTPAAHRAARFEEFVELTDRLLRQSYTTSSGRFFSALDARMVPGCVQRPRVPFAIAANGPRGMRLAARHADTWVTIGDARHPGERTEREAFALLAEQSARLAEACHEAGRAPDRMGRLVNLSRIVPDPCSSPERLADYAGRCGGLGFTDIVVTHPRRAGPFAGDHDAFWKALGCLLDGSNQEDGAIRD